MNTTMSRSQTLVIQLGRERESDSFGHQCGSKSPSSLDTAQRDEPIDVIVARHQAHQASADHSWSCILHRTRRDG